MSDTEISNRSELEKDWLKWTGINALKEALPTGVAIGKAGLYKRFTPGEPYKAVSYVMRCELTGLTEEGDKTGSELVGITRGSGAPGGLELLDSALYVLDADTISEAARSK